MSVVARVGFARNGLLIAPSPFHLTFFFLIMIYFFGFAPLTPADCPGGGARLRRNHLTASEWSLCDVVAERVPGG